MANYDTLPLSAELQRAIAQMGFTQMTEVQEKAIPLMMEEKEVTAKAPTGTGKTCAFGVPIVEKLSGEETKPAALILCPTRELCQQIVEELRALALFKPGIHIAAIYGGQPIEKQDQTAEGGGPSHHRGHPRPSQGPHEPQNAGYAPGGDSGAGRG